MFLNRFHDIVVYALFGITHAHVAGLISQETAPTEKIVDEVFHITQTQTFCKIAAGSSASKATVYSTIQSMYDSYDNKITTPPGPYFFAQWYSQYILQDTECSNESIRSTNIVFNLATVIVLNEILKALEEKGERNSPVHYKRLLILILQPVHFFFGFLFYTDAGSTFFIMLSYLFALKVKFHSAWTSLAYLYACSASGWISLWFRQTNVIWYGFIIGTIMVRFFEEVGAVKKTYESPLVEIVTFFSNMLKYVFRDCVTSVSKCAYAFLALLPIVAVLSSFLLFLRWNNYHIVLGDQSNHTPVFHAPQIFYFVAFTLIPTFHLDLLPHAVAWNVTQLKRGARNAMSMPNILGIVCVGVLTYKFTMIHPFILADNRHYTFYLWNKLLKHRFVQLSMVPIYFYLGKIFWSRLLQQKGFVWLLGYTCCTFLVLIPAHLIEFRYFTIPMFFASIHLLLQSRQKQPVDWYMKWTILAFIVVNSALVYIFLYRTFTYADGSVGRFMF